MATAAAASVAALAAEAVYWVPGVSFAGRRGSSSTASRSRAHCEGRCSSGSEDGTGLHSEVEVASEAEVGRLEAVDRGEPSRSRQGPAQLVREGLRCSHKWRSRCTTAKCIWMSSRGFSACRIVCTSLRLATVTGGYWEAREGEAWVAAAWAAAVRATRARRRLCSHCSHATGTWRSKAAGYTGNTGSKAMPATARADALAVAPAAVVQAVLRARLRRREADWAEERNVSNRLLHSQRRRPNSSAGRCSSAPTRLLCCRNSVGQTPRCNRGLCQSSTGQAGWCKQSGGGEPAAH